MKTCSKCGIEQPLSEYHYKRGKTQNRCKACRSEYQKAHYLANRERERAIRKAWYEDNKSRVSIKGKADRSANPEKFKLGRRLKKYGLTKGEYLEKIAIQNNKCEICDKPFTETPYIDHCHDSGALRGLLCSSCNTGFGLLKEDVAIFERCIAYSRKYKK